MPLLEQSTVDSFPLLRKGTEVRHEVPFLPNTLVPSILQALSLDGVLGLTGLTFSVVSLQLTAQVLSLLQELSADSDGQVYTLPLPSFLVPVYEELSLLPPQADKTRADPMTNKLTTLFNLHSL